MIKDDTVYIGHMLDLSRKVAAKVQAKTRAEFDADENLRLALAHLVQTIGESCRHLPAPGDRDVPDCGRVNPFPVVA
jgi:uncharacterized protein with HEPN domain